MAGIRFELYFSWRMLSSIQHNPVIKRFYENLVDQGKHKKIAITASMGKIMRILNTMVRN